MGWNRIGEGGWVRKGGEGEFLHGVTHQQGVADGLLGVLPQQLCQAISLDDDSPQKQLEHTQAVTLAERRRLLLK